MEGIQQEEISDAPKADERDRQENRVDVPMARAVEVRDNEVHREVGGPGQEALIAADDVAIFCLPEAVECFVGVLGEGGGERDHEVEDEEAAVGDGKFGEDVMLDVVTDAGEGVGCIAAGWCGGFRFC